MIINGRKTLNELIKDYSSIILVGIITLFLLFYATLNTLVQYFEKQESIKVAKEIEHKKIESIKLSKPGLICKDKYLAPSDYDVVAINDKIIIETINTIGKPQESINFSDCSIYDKITVSIVIPEPLTMEQRVANELKSLQVRNEFLQTENNNYKTKVDSLEKLILEKNNELKRVINLVDEKQKNINELTEYSIKYKEVKELLSVALSGQNNKLNEVMTRLLNTPIKPESDFKTKSEESKIIEDARKVSEVKKPLDLKLTESGDNNIEIQLQLRAYIIKEISKKLSTRIDIEKIKMPTQEELNANKITEAQLKNWQNTLNSYNNTIDKMIEVLGKITYVDKPLLVKNVNEVLAMVPHGTK